MACYPVVKLIQRDACGMHHPSHCIIELVGGEGRVTFLIRKIFDDYDCDDDDDDDVHVDKNNIPVFI